MIFVYIHVYEYILLYEGLAPGSYWWWSSSPNFPGSWNYNPYAIQTLRATACRWSNHCLGQSSRRSSKIPSPSSWRTDSLAPNVSYQPCWCLHYCTATIPRSSNITSFTCEWPFFTLSSAAITRCCMFVQTQICTCIFFNLPCLLHQRQQERIPDSPKNPGARKKPNERRTE